jgi:hypothetical protein
MNPPSGESLSTSRVTSRTASPQSMGRLRREERLSVLSCRALEQEVMEQWR